MKPLMLDTFSGIGGFSLAGRWAGFETVGFCEKEEFCRAVLAKHWPGVPCHDDITTLTVDLVRGWLAERRLDLLTGGFPCQDISAANPSGEGLDGARSGLWFELLRLVRELRPAWLLAENVPNLFSRGIDAVLDGLEEAGYEAAACVVGAWAVGAPHERNRCWIVAHRHGAEFPSRPERPRSGRFGRPGPCGGRGDAADGVAQGDPIEGGLSGVARWRTGALPADGHLGVEELGVGQADAEGVRMEGDGAARFGQPRAPSGQGLPGRDGSGGGATDGSTEPGLGGVPDGLPARMDGRWPAGKGRAQFDWEPPRLAPGLPGRAARVAACGNAIVPQVAVHFLDYIHAQLKEDPCHSPR